MRRISPINSVQAVLITAPVVPAVAADPIAAVGQPALTAGDSVEFALDACAGAVSPDR